MSVSSLLLSASLMQLSSVLSSNFMLLLNARCLGTTVDASGSFQYGAGVMLRCSASRSVAIAALTTGELLVPCALKS